MSINRRTAVVGALTVTTAFAALAGTVLPAGAASSASFLSASQLPQGDEFGDWTRHSLHSGLPSPTWACIKNTLPSSKTTYRKYSSDADLADGGVGGEAREMVSVLNNSSDAKDVAKDVRRSIEKCADKIGEDTTWKDYGHHSTEDGLDVYGVFFAPPGSEYHLQMFGVGRDGRKVVVVGLSQQGRKSDAPVTRFTKTAKTALSKAF